MDVVEDKGWRWVRAPHTGEYLIEHAEPRHVLIAGRTVYPHTQLTITLRRGESVRLPGTGRLFARYRDRYLSSPWSW